MLRICVKLSIARLLDDSAEIHHRDLIGKMLDDREIVRDEQIGDFRFDLEILQKIQDLRLDRDVQRADGLVADNEIGLECKARAMPMRWRCPPENSCGYREAKLGSSPTRARRDATLSLRSLPRQAVNLDRLADDVADAHARIQAADRILEDNLHVTAKMTKLFALIRKEIVALVSGPIRLLQG